MEVRPEKKPVRPTGMWSSGDDRGMMHHTFEFTNHRRRCNRWMNQKLRPANRSRLSWKLERNMRIAPAGCPSRSLSVMASIRGLSLSLMFSPQKQPSQLGSVSVSELGARLDAMGLTKTFRLRKILDLVRLKMALPSQTCRFLSVVYSFDPVRRPCGFTSC